MQLRQLERTRAMPRAPFGLKRWSNRQRASRGRLRTECHNLMPEGVPPTRVQPTRIAPIYYSQNKHTHYVRCKKRKQLHIKEAGGVEPTDRHHETLFHSCVFSATSGRTPPNADGVARRQGSWSRDECVPFVCWHVASGLAFAADLTPLRAEARVFLRQAAGPRLHWRHCGRRMGKYGHRGGRRRRAARNGARSRCHPQSQQRYAQSRCSSRPATWH